jgi:ABC-2 type transport system ATP-binding protein
MLDIGGISKRFGTLQALDGVSFSVAPGELFGFVGSNGAGKTTTMRIVLGVLAADAGHVRWHDAPVDADVRRRIGYMPEERGLYPKMKVGEQLRYLARLHGIGEAEAAASVTRWTERLGVDTRVGDEVQKLSLGNQQRVQLAAALVHGPDLLVLDEPFSGLDPVAIDAVAGVLAEAAGRGAAVLFSSHQLDLVEHVCQSVVIVHRGRVVAAGTVDELATAGPARLVVAVEGDPEGHWAASVSGVSMSEVEGGAVRLVLGDGADPQAVLRAAQAAGPVEHFAFERRRLSEVFREAVGG